MPARKHYIIFAGINGAGKSTLFQSKMWNREGLANENLRVNSDEIIVANGWDWSDFKAQMEAGRQVVKLVKQYLSQGKSFNQETTLAGHSIMRTIEQAKSLGYYITLYYIGVEDPEIANKRISQRIEWGGHGVDPDTVRKRAKSSLDNLVEAVGICDEVSLFDNSRLLQSVGKLAKRDLVSYETGLASIKWADDLMLRLLARYGFQARYNAWQ